MVSRFGKVTATFWARRQETAAVRAAARGDHIAALGAYERPPVQVQSALGLHAAVLLQNAGATNDERVSTALAAAELGAPERALEAVGSNAGRLPASDRMRLALAIGRWTPNAAMSLSPPGARLLNSALALRAGQTELAAELIPSSSRTFAADHKLLVAKIAAARGDHRAARRAANAAFRHFGLSEPLDETIPAPISLSAFGAASAGRGLPPSPRPLVSVIMPARNAERTIGVAIRSVLSQSWRNLELIVVDDASTDTTADAVRIAIAAEPRARLIQRSTAAGAYAARNDGLAAASGLFATFNDADDWSHPDRIARGVAPLLASPALMATQSRLVRLAADGQFTAQRIFPLVRANPSSLLFRRPEVLAALGGFEEVPFGADEEFSARLTACFGAATLLRQRLLLAVASESPASLTGSTATGLASVEGVRARVAYREAWHQQHLEIHRQEPRARRGPAWFMPLRRPPERGADD